MKLPASIVLKAGPTLRSADICEAFGFTRQSLNYYRRRHDFPRAPGRNAAARYDTRHVTSWCAARGVKITWI
ncbi:hypothetical protein FJ945_26090 [Mesorhizobium sp. B2-4-9]|uniref:hypothetical protein n=1 Tax=Mesorhizobium sp. B2-4-9 TaxID=2589940 RepID=UPI00112609CE|nr:hypothetical protein [Mesorhizobium sp. B2-4-9]TPL16960.1 hypothetical protein FJ945_26090 [Mesorhizobium sp. B2-4-9]